MPVLYLDRREALTFVYENQALFDAAGAANPFACSQWLRLFIRHIATENWRFIVPVRAEGCMLLYVRPDEPQRYFAPANHYAPLYAPVATSMADRTAVLQGLAQSLTKHRPDCAAVNFAPLDADASDTQALENAFDACGWVSKRYVCFGNWYLPSAGLSFDAYMSERDPHLYALWARKSKCFHSGDEGARIELYTSPAEAGEGLRAYGQIDARNRKRSEACPALILDWIRACAEQRWLRLGVAYVHDTPVAAQFWFTLHGRAYLYRSFFDETYARYAAPAVLTAHMIEHSLERDRVQEIIDLSGTDAFMRFWLPARRERIGLLMCNRGTMRGLLLATHQSCSDARQQWLRDFRPAPAMPPAPPPGFHAQHRRTGSDMSYVRL